jgi:hypothetical protein
MAKRIKIIKEKKNQYIGFFCSENMLMYIQKILENQKPQRFDNISSLIRHCLEKQLPLVAEELGVETK